MVRLAFVDSTTYKDLVGHSADSMAITETSAVGPLCPQAQLGWYPQKQSYQSPVEVRYLVWPGLAYQARVIRAYAELKSWNMNCVEGLLAAVSLQMRGAALNLLCAGQWNPYSRSLKLGMCLTGLLISCIYSLACHRALLDTTRCRNLAYFQPWANPNAYGSHSNEGPLTLKF